MPINTVTDFKCKTRKKFNTFLNVGKLMSSLFFSIGFSTALNAVLYYIFLI